MRVEEKREHVRLTKIFRFSASHRLFFEKLSERENFAAFDRCSNPAGHGHDYAVEVGIRGEIDPETGMVVGRVDLERRARPLIEELDYRRLDRDIPFFRTNMSTVENIGMYLRRGLERVFPGKVDRVRVWENSRSFFECSGDGR